MLTYHTKMTNMSLGFSVNGIPTKLSRMPSFSLKQASKICRLSLQVA